MYRGGNMISVYDLTFYNRQLSDAQKYNFPIVKRKIELQNRLAKCKSKTKRNKLLKEYLKVKSLCLGIMYGGASLVHDKFTSGSRVIFQNNHIIQSKLADDFLKSEAIVIAGLIKKNKLKETCCGDCFILEK